MTWREYRAEKEDCGWKFSPGSEVMLGNRSWMQVDVKLPKGSQGRLLMPLRFYELWRRLQWGITYFEKMWSLWEEEVSERQNEQRTRGRKAAMELGRRSCAMRLLCYMSFRRAIVNELVTLDHDNWSEDQDDRNEPFRVFIEFGLRDYRSWMFSSFEDAQDEEAELLALDPTAPENMEALCKPLLFMFYFHS